MRVFARECTETVTEYCKGVAGQRQKLEAMLKSTEQRGIEAQESIEKDTQSPCTLLGESLSYGIL
eukprot:2225114-Amphidinium_carterae.2